jgi:hypothetical protein
VPVGRVGLLRNPGSAAILAACIHRDQRSLALNGTKTTRNPISWGFFNSPPVPDLDSSRMFVEERLRQAGAALRHPFAHFI